MTNIHATSINIQYKNTDICFDFYCACGAQSHFDGYFASAIQCSECGQKYDMPAQPTLLPFSGQYEPKILQADSEGWK